MMDSMESPQHTSTHRISTSSTASPSTNRSSISYREEDLVAPDLAELDEENVVLPPEYEIESTPAPTRSHCRIACYSCLGIFVFAFLCLVAVLMIPPTDSGPDHGFMAMDGDGSHGESGFFTMQKDGEDKGNGSNEGPINVEGSTLPPEAKTTAPTTAGPIMPNKSDAEYDFETTTPAPTAVAAPLTPSPTLTIHTPSPTTPEAPLWQKKGCLTSFLDNENMEANKRIYAGQYICSVNNNQRYRFGVDMYGNVIYQDKESDSLQLLFKNPYKKSNQQLNNQREVKETYYMELLRNGDLVLHWVDYNENGTEDTVIYKASPKTDKMALTEQCQPDHDCPYLHIQPDGVLTANWLALEDTDGDAMYDFYTKDFLAIYNH